MIDNVFGEAYRTARLGVDRVGNLTEIFRVDDLVRVRARSLQPVVSCACQRQATPFCRMAQHNPLVVV